MKQTVLVTGNLGFIGSHLVDALKKKGYRVVGTDNLDGGSCINQNPKIIQYFEDCKDFKAMSAIFKIEKPEIVFHLAADATEGRSQFTPVRCTENGLLASTNVFTAAIKNKVKRIIYFSSLSVYGNQDPPFSEEMEPKPVDVYGVNKAATEKVLEILCKVHKIEYVIFRPHNVFGEKQNMKDAYRNAVGIFINRIMQGKPPIIYGDGEQVRAFSYIDNLIPCVVKAITAPVNREIFNIGPTETQTVNYMAEIILKEFKSKLKPEYVDDRPVEVKCAHCTVDKAKKLLGYKTRVSFEEGIKRMVYWAKLMGPQEFIYLDNLELTSGNVPKTWKKKLI